MSITYIVCHNLYIMKYYVFDTLLTLSIILLPTILLEE